MGLLLGVVAHPADIQDRDGAKPVIDKLAVRFPEIRLIGLVGAVSSIKQGL